MKQSLRERLKKLDLKTPPKRRPSENDDGYFRLRSQLGIEFGIDATVVWKTENCPVLLWMTRCSDGVDSAQDMSLLDEISRVQYFDVSVTTRDYLLAVPRVLRAV